MSAEVHDNLIPIWIERDGKRIRTGEVRGSKESGLNYETLRNEKTVFHSTPCRNPRHESGRCDGFAISEEALEKAEQVGAVRIKVMLILGHESVNETYLKNLLQFKAQASRLQEKDGRAQLALPLHDWVLIKQ